MQLDLNNLTYGNPSRKHLERAREELYLIADYEPSIPPPPKNSDPYVMGELMHLVAVQKQLLNDPFMDFVEDADEELEEVFEDFLDENDIPFDYYKRLFKDLSIIVIRLKMRFNRMRPFQVANILNVPLYPLNSESAHSASYPSGHTLQAYVMSEMIAEQYPELANKARRLAEMVALSRKVGGWHYESDNWASINLGKELMPKILRPEEV